MSFTVKLVQQVEGLALSGPVDALGVGDMKNRVDPFAKRDALLLGRQDPGSPHGGSATQVSAASHDYETREIIGLASDPIAQPGTHAGPTRNTATSGHEQLSGSMVEMIGVHRLDEGKVVGDLGQMRESIG